MGGLARRARARLHRAAGLLPQTTSLRSTQSLWRSYDRARPFYESGSVGSWNGHESSAAEVNRELELDSPQTATLRLIT